MCALFMKNKFIRIYCPLKLRRLLLPLFLVIAVSIFARDIVGTEEKTAGYFDVARATTAEALDHAARCSDLGLFAEETQVLEALKYSGREMTDAERARCLYRLALSYYSTGTYQLSLKNLFELLRMPKPDSLRYYDVSAKIILSGTYMRFHASAQADSVLRLVDQDLKRYDFGQTRMKKLRRDYYLEKSTVHADRGEWAEYINMLKEIDKYAEDNHDNALRRKLDYGIYYMQTDRPDLAERYYKSIRLEPEWSYDKMAAMVNYAEMLYNIRRFEDAVTVSDEALEMIKGHRMDQMKSTIFLVKGLSLFELGDAQRAVPYLEESRQIRDSIFEWHTSHSVLGSAKDFERDMDSNGYEAMRRANYRSWIYIAVLVVILISGVVLIVRLRRKLKGQEIRNAELAGELESIESRHTADLSDTLRDLSETKRRIVSLTLKLAQVNDVVRKAIDKESGAGDSERLASLQEGMKHVDLNRNVWETFDLLFEQTNPRFYKDLSQRHPDLTKGEKRMCAYIKLELSTKEIATVTNRSTRTVETVRYRLRKKLNIPEGVSLETYISELSS